MRACSATSGPVALCSAALRKLREASRPRLAVLGQARADTSRVRREGETQGGGHRRCGVVWAGDAITCAFYVGPHACEGGGCTCRPGS